MCYAEAMFAHPHLPVLIQIANKKEFKKKTSDLVLKPKPVDRFS
jgi:hypothetical protein